MDPARRPHLEHREHPLNASPTDQLRLLDLQALDTRLDQLAHRRRTLPEHAEIERVDARLRQARDLLVAAQTEHGDVERERRKADADVEQVRARATRDQQRLDSGAVTSAKDLENLQHEIASLARRQSALEDVELEIMERLEGIEERVAELRGEVAALEEERAAVVARRDAALAEIAAEEATTRDLRGTLSGQIDPALVALYEKVREQQGGIGAAMLQHRRCQGCRLELNAQDIARIRAAAEDAVLRCEECRRILVRTAESGL